MYREVSSSSLGDYIDKETSCLDTSQSNISNGFQTSEYVQNSPSEHVCPVCGYCPCCGRKYGVAPYTPYVPYYDPYIVTWIS